MPVEDDLRKTLAEAEPEAKQWAKSLLDDAAKYGQALLDGRQDRADEDGEPLSLDQAVAAANRLEAKLADEVKFRDDGAALAQAALAKGLRIALAVALGAIA